jgi:hypothetical protein
VLTPVLNAHANSDAHAHAYAHPPHAHTHTQTHTHAHTRPGTCQGVQRQRQRYLGKWRRGEAPSKRAPRPHPLALVQCPTATAMPHVQGDPAALISALYSVNRAGERAGRRAGAGVCGVPWLSCVEMSCVALRCVEMS